MSRFEKESLTNYTVPCWKCKEQVDEHDIIAVTDGRTSWMELCQDCYNFYLC
ncbi:DUF7685 domain-containing protein [Halobacillus amylolyticus]